MVPLPRPSDRRVQTVCLLILTLICVGVALALLQPVLVPFVLALFLSQCLAPLIHLLMKRAHLPRVIAVSVAALVGAGMLTAAGFIIAASLGGKSNTNQFQAYQESLNHLTHRVLESRPAHWLGIRPDAAGGAQSYLPSLSDAAPYITTTLGQVANIVSHTATVLLLMAFLLYGRRWSAAEPTPGDPQLGLAQGGIIAEIELRVQRYISLTVFISTLTGVLVGASLSILGVKFAAVFGLLAFLLNFIPNVGAVIATLLPIPIVLLDPNLAIVVKLLAIAIPGAVQVVIGSLVQPRMMGQSLDLHPVMILMSLLFFTMIWGVGGAFLATPLTAVIKIVFERIPYTRPLAALLAGDLNPLTRTIDATERATAPAPELDEIVVFQSSPPQAAAVSKPPLTGGANVYPNL